MDPYGNPLGTPTGTWHNRLGFLGKHQDTTTGLTELGARLYDPTTGRFTQVDPIGEPHNPQQTNGYNYGWNSPGSTVAIFVYSEGPYVGQIATAFVPGATNLRHWDMVGP
ncbi:RHS repeat-associated core domain protein (plasmid) [Variovorax sp. PBS-H4]|uniref:RHS repeat-associated core domain-containing protein n=1 Tax=Variovorax sp. PBS-H4 TaxID=434008 RepID=UPI0013194F4A|nr:RHS repeat-associated core domain-containing protein [Variovorax sp. PBS-H4]VTU41456.1 RHS repeat-associated core domain protein [Variovorax sp. PBS-H4]